MFRYYFHYGSTITLRDLEQFTSKASELCNRQFPRKVTGKWLIAQCVLTPWWISCVFTVLHRWKQIFFGDDTVIIRTSDKILLAKFFLLRLYLGKKFYATMKGLLRHLGTIDSLSLELIISPSH